jgi:hypothetical protein
MLKLKRKISILQPTDRELGKRISKQGPTDCKRDLESPARELLQRRHRDKEKQWKGLTLAQSSGANQEIPGALFARLMRRIEG